MARGVGSHTDFGETSKYQCDVFLHCLRRCVYDAVVVRSSRRRVLMRMGANYVCLILAPGEASWLEATRDEEP